MTFNPIYAELMGREQYKIRLEEAERKRLINTITLANPSTTKKVWLILRDRWTNLLDRKQGKKTYPPVSRMERKSPSL